MDKIIENSGPLMERPARGADNSQGDRRLGAFEQESKRAPDGNGPFSHQDIGRVPELCDRQLRFSVHLQHSQIGFIVRSHNARLEFITIGQCNLYLVSTLDHVLIGENISPFVNDES